ncbi:penicillin-binding protein 2 [Pseudaeromonas paramecii]|uniref:Peptidoglycan D,D-transpeptidase MrdA n=1 Tax=Pseudaeromonas paramecii TaxID=2138166 RepID=A0ABP8QDN3_9GAMM
MLKQRISIKDNGAEAALFYRRALVAGIGMALLSCLLLANLYWLQVVNHDTYQTRSNDNRIKVVPVAPPRGLIFDRNGVLLAENRPVFSLEIVPDQTQDLHGMVKQLIQLLDLDPSTEEQFYREVKRTRRFNPVPLVEQLTDEQVARFSVNQHRFPGADIEAYLKRFYPYGETLTHALGYVARINVKDLQRLDEAGKLANYAATRDIGKLGVEKYYEDQLHGQAGYQEVEVNNRGRVIRTLKYQPPVAGQDIYLNVDIRLQQKAQQLLAGRRGGIVLMDPRDGSVLALESSPSYDPNLFVRGISSRDYSALLNDPARPLINRTSQGGYAPASTVKPLLSIMGLNEGLITPQTRFFGGPTFQIPGVARKWRDWKRWGHGWMDMHRAIEVSADTFFYDLAFRAGIDTLHDYMSRFGFGNYSGLDIYEESTGIMPSRQWKQSRWRQPWYQGDTISVGIGQGYWTATPIQLARAHSILTQHGRNIVPHLLRSVGAPDGEQTPYRVTQEPALTVKNDGFWQEAMEGMYLVLNGPEGTARRAFAGTPYKAAGKSGTAQVVNMKENEKYDASRLKEEHRDNALFVAFAPYEEPTAVVAMILENAGGGSANAAPVARALLDAYLLGKYDDEPAPEEKKP